MSSSGGHHIDIKNSRYKIELLTERRDVEPMDM